jgi:hypothetical protein
MNANRNIAVAVFGGIGIIFMLISSVMLAVAINQLLQEQRYQVGNCTITARRLAQEISTQSNTQNNTTSSSIVYAANFSFQVRTIDGRSYGANGYDGSDVYTSDYEGQQALVDRYTVGQAYQCWYNPANPSQAVLVRNPNWFFFILGGGFLLIGALFAVIGLLVLLGRFRVGRTYTNVVINLDQPPGDF